MKATTATLLVNVIVVVVDRKKHVEAIHKAVCDTPISDCLEYHGKCVKAFEAIMEIGQ